MKYIYKYIKIDCGAKQDNNIYIHTSIILIKPRHIIYMF